VSVFGAGWRTAPALTVFPPADFTVMLLKASSIASVNRIRTSVGARGSVLRSAGVDVSI
jgi:hypothetical protein